MDPGGGNSVCGAEEMAAPPADSFGSERGGKCSKRKFGAPQEAAGAVGWEQEALGCSGIQEPPSGTGSEPRWSWIIPKVPSIPIQSGISGILSCPLPFCPRSSSSPSCPPPSPNPLLPFASPTSSVGRGGNETLWIFGINTSQAGSATLSLH